jgi:hypothetical protein
VDNSVAVEVGTGVMGEKIRGFGVAVGSAAVTTGSAGNVCAGCTICAGVRVASALQAVTSVQTTKVKYSARCIAAKYSGRKLSGDECYETSLRMLARRVRRSRHLHLRVICLTNHADEDLNLRKALRQIYAKLAL